MDGGIGLSGVYLMDCWVWFGFLFDGVLEVEGKTR